MAGIKGQIHRNPKAGTLRRKAWQSMRILRRFTIPDICRTTGAKRSNVRKFIQRLQAHGYVETFGPYVSGRPGLYLSYRLMRDIGPDYPTVCDRCGRALGKPCLGDAHE